MTSSPASQDRSVTPSTPSTGEVARPIPFPGRRDRSAEAHGATVALASVIDALDPIASRRAAVRYAVVDRCVAAIEVDLESRVDALTAALLAELGAVLSTHPTTGPSAAAQAGDVLQSSNALSEVALGLRHQHERWDGSGGPDSLSGKAIPLVSRLVAIGSAVADVITEVDDELSWTEAVQRIQDLSGTHLDPAIAEAYLTSIDRGGPARQHHAGDVFACVGLLEQIRPFGLRSSDALANIGAAIGAVDDLGQLLALIADQARRSIDATTVSVGRYRPEQQLIEVLVNVGELEPGQQQFPVDEVHPFTMQADASVTSVNQRGSELGSLLAAPVRAGSAVWGTVLARAAPDRPDFDHDDLDMLGRVAAELGNAVEKVERLAAVVDMALRDPLTGVGNRRILDQRLADVFDRPVNERGDCALIMCDLDGLKTINDTLGHNVGDRVLTKVANTLRAAVTGYPNTEVCRIGGDEFCVIVERGAQLAAEPIRERIEDLVARLDDPPVSVSCGIAMASSTTRAPSELLRAADEAQYAVKRSRRDRSGPSGTPGRRRRRDS